MTIKDWITMTMAVIAFVLSLITTYVNSWPTNELALIVSKTPRIGFQENNEVRTRGDVELTFINAGNRPIGVVAVEFMLVQPQQLVEFKDCKGEGGYGQIEFKP